MPKIKYVINFMMLNTIFLLYCMKLSHINHDEKIYTAVFLNFILTSRIKVYLFSMSQQLCNLLSKTVFNIYFISFSRNFLIPLLNLFLVTSAQSLYTVFVCNFIADKKSP